MYKFFKRTLDIVLSFLGMIVLSPFFLLLVLAIKLDSKGPVLFKQKRVGLHKKHFYILKFRTMRIDTPKDTPTHLLKNPEQWITKVGKFLRKTSLDELPQIWNIFAGEVLAGLLLALSQQAFYWYPVAFIGSMLWTAFSIFISCIQAYVFTMLSSMYIGKKINGEEE